jgi:hypothetical protein
MIENLRKYPGVIIAALVAVFVGFLLMDSQQFFRNRGAQSITVNGTSYDAMTYERLGPNSLRLASQLNSYQPFRLDMQMFAGALINQEATSEEGVQKSFFVNRILLQQAGRDYGIHPGKEEIQKYIRERSIFADQDPTDPSIKTFNQQSYDNFVKTNLGQFGMSEKDLLVLVSDMLLYEKFSKLIANSMQVDADIVKRSNQATKQKISLSYTSLPLPTFQEKLKPTEEELKAFWELRKDKYNTESRRSFSYVMITPKYSPVAEKAPEPPKPAKPGDPIPEPTDADKKIIEERQKAQLAATAVMDDLLNDIETSKGAEFESSAEKSGLKIEKTEFFTPTTIPDVLLALTPRKTDKTITSLLFDMKVTSDAISKFTSSMPVGEADWLLARLDAEEPSRSKTFEEAQEEVRTEWLAEKGLEALKAAAEETKKKIEQTIHSGKSFADASKEAGYESQSIVRLGNGEKKDGHPAAEQLFNATKYVNPGSLTELIVTDDAALIAHVNKREIYIDPNAEMTAKSDVDSAKTSLGYSTFADWLMEQNAKAKVSP